MFSGWVFFLHVYLWPRECLVPVKTGRGPQIPWHMCLLVTMRVLEIKSDSLEEQPMVLNSWIHLSAPRYPFLYGLPASPFLFWGLTQSRMSPRCSQDDLNVWFSCLQLSKYWDDMRAPPCPLLWGSEYRTQGFMHAWQAFYQLSYTSSYLVFLTIKTLYTF